MTDNKGASKGPYFHRCGTIGEASTCKACAYEHGRKAERERCLRMVYKYTTWEFDGSGRKPSLSVSTVDDIVEAIKGEKDAK